jgi:acyl-CoA synthetase (AMP-forming)/AMP-acid ligase II
MSSPKRRQQQVEANDTVAMTALAAGAAALGVGAYVADSNYRVSQDVGLLLKMAAAGQHIIRAKGTNFTVADNWERTLNNLGDRNKKCFISADDGAVWTFNDVDLYSNQIAHWCTKNGLMNRDVCGLFMENKPEYIATWLGLCKAGVIIALINSNNKRKPLIHSIETGNCKAMIFGTELTQPMSDIMAELEEVSMPVFASGDGCPAFARSLSDELKTMPDTPVDKEAVRPGLTPDDVFGYIYTSGTTGLPKACVMRNAKFMLAGSLAKSYGLVTEDIVYTVLPLYHSAGGMLGAGCVVNSGCTMVLTKKFSATNFWRHCYEHKATVTQYIGELARYLLNSPESEWDQKHAVRLAMGNGMRKEVWVPFQKRFRVPEIGEFYGATEGNVSFQIHSVTKDFVNFPGNGAMGSTGATTEL